MRRELAVTQHTYAPGNRRCLRIVDYKQDRGPLLAADISEQRKDFTPRRVSRLPVGSSARISRGSLIKARAIATL